MCAAYNDGVCASQLTPTQILLEMNEQMYTLKTEMQVQVIAVSREYIVVSSGRQIIVNRINKGTNLNASVLATFSCDTEKMLIYEHTLIVLTPTIIQLRSIEGSVIQTLPTLPEEGEPITMELTGKHFRLKQCIFIKFFYHPKPKGIIQIMFYYFIKILFITSYYYLQEKIRKFKNDKTLTLQRGRIAHS